jgi:ribosome-associated protein
MGHRSHLTSGIIACMSNPEIEEIPIRDDMIRLGQLLKLASLVEDGVEAAELIKGGLVKVNGEIDDRRGRQLHNGDSVTVNGRTVRISTPAGS